MKTIITFTTNPTIDKSSSVENVVAERKLYCKTPHFEPGGGGINVARAIKKLGGESSEFRELVGLEIKDEQQIRAEAEKLVKSGQCQVIVISLGASGALVVSVEFIEHIYPPTVPIISKVGAGDSMVAGIVLSLAQGKKLYDAILYGIACGSAAVMTPGTELCRREDAEKLYKMLVSEFK